MVTVCVESRASGVTYRYVVRNEGRARADSAYVTGHWTLRFDGQDNAVGRFTRSACDSRGR